MVAGKESRAYSMKIELTRSEIEQIILDHVNEYISGQCFNKITGGPYRDLPSTITVEVEVKHDTE